MSTFVNRHNQGHCFDDAALSAAYRIHPTAAGGEEERLSQRRSILQAALVAHLRGLQGTAHLAGSGGRVHLLKTWPIFFADLLTGRKTFEVRKNDRGYEQGDFLILMEWDRATGQYTGRVTVRRVTYVLVGGGGMGIELGTVVMSVEGVGGAVSPRTPLEYPFGGTGGGLTQCDMHDDESN